MTSFDVVAYLRGILRIKKIGHAGTLDPGAVGVLPVCIGNATKALEYMTDKDKSYRAELTLGVSTDTQDSFGKIVAARDIKASDEQIKDTIMSFTGKYEQKPPMYSAVKVGGKKLYELARSGVTVERKSREVEIFSIELIGIHRDEAEGSAGLHGQVRVMFDVSCSRGTYIRTLCADIGEKLGCGGHMSFLIRTRAGVFSISSSVTLEEVYDLARQGSLSEKLINIDEVFKNFDRVLLDNPDEKRLLNGAFVKLNSCNFKPGEIVRVYSKKDSFIALGEIKLKQGNLLLKSKKLF